MAAAVVGAAVLGLGVGRQHAMAYARAEGARLNWVYDLVPGRMSEVVAELGAGAPAVSLDQVLADPGTSLVSIASFDDHHAREVVASLRSGKNVFCEKPLCRTPEELAAIARAWRESGRALVCNLVLRSAPLYRWLREAVAAGELGQIYAFDGEYLYGRLEKITGGWRSAVEDYSVMLGGGVHLADLMLWITGQRPVAVSSVGNRICTAGTAFRYFDFVASTFTFASGLVGRISANFGCVHRHQHVVRVFGTKATFLYDDMGARVVKSRDPAVPATLLDLVPLPASKGELIPQFVADLRRGADLSAQTRHEFDVVAACMAADRALATGEPEPITYL